MSKGKILVVSQHFWPESFRINDICEGFIENGYEVDVLCGLPNYPKGEFFDGYGYLKKKKENYKNINIMRVLEIKRADNSNLRILLNYLSFPFFSLFKIPLLINKKYDKIFLYQTSPVMMSIVGIILGKLKKIETTIYILDLWPENLFSVLDIKNKFFRNIAYKISRWHYNNVDKIIVVSNSMKTYLENITKLKKENIIFIPQYCEKIYEEKKCDLNLRNKFKDGFNLVFTGNISPAQSFETILYAAKKLKDDGISDINWIIVGDGMSKIQVENDVQALGLSDCFFFIGMVPVKDIPLYTEIADGLIACLVKSDLLEYTIPAKITSYFASGKAVVIAMDGEIKDIVNKFSCGFAGSAGSSVEFYENVKKLYFSSDKNRTLLGENAKNYYLNNFERNLNLKKLIEFIFN